MAAFRLVPAWAWVVVVLVFALGTGLIYQTLQLESVLKDYADYKADIVIAATEASEKARQTEQQRQRDIDQVRADAADQKQKDDALTAEQRADNDSLRDETRQLLADKSALNTRLAKRGKTIDDLVDLLAELRSEADGYAGELASALTASRRAGFACERAYDAVDMPS